MTMNVEWQDKRVIMTPKQREILVNFQEQICNLESYLGSMRRQLRELPKHFDSAQNKSEFTTDEINELLRFNDRLAELERYLCDLGANENLHVAARVSDSNDPLNDYEIDATLYFTLREDDPEFDEDDDNFLTKRKMSLKHLDREWGLGDGRDHRVSIPHFPGSLNEIAHCWLFHDLYDHSYGLEQPALSLQDCLRVGSIWVDVAVRHQATLAIKSGKWH